MRTAPATLLLAVALLSACGDGAVVACGPVERPELQGGGHLLGDQEPPVPYSSTPGTSGFHASGAPRTGVFGPDDALTEPQIVRTLEDGQVVAAYDPDALADDEVDELVQLARGDLDGELTVTPFEGDMGAALTLNAWGVRRPCSSVDPDTVRGFVTDHGGGAPGPD